MDSEILNIFSLVYVLELENDKYYVGVTTNLNLRYCQHVTGRGGAKWTRLHKPLRILSVEVGDRKVEREKTLEMMREHGWQNVRGGGWSQVNLKKPQPLREKCFPEKSTT